MTPLLKSRQKNKSQSFECLGEKSMALTVFTFRVALLLQQPALPRYPHLRQKETVTAKRKATWQDDKHGDYKTAFMWGTELAWMRGWMGRDGLAFVAAGCAEQARCQRGDTDTEHELCRVSLCSAAEAFIACQAAIPRALGGRWQPRFLHNPSVLAGRCKGERKNERLAAFFVPITSKPSLAKGLHFLSQLSSPHHDFRMKIKESNNLPPHTDTHLGCVYQHLPMVTQLFLASPFRDVF